MKTKTIVKSSFSLMQMKYQLIDKFKKSWFSEAKQDKQGRSNKNQILIFGT